MGGRFSGYNHIDQQVNEMISRSENDVKILMSLADAMNDLKKILDSTVKNELNQYCQKYDGFYHFMKILEGLATGISDGSIPVP